MSPLCPTRRRPPLIVDRHAAPVAPAPPTGPPHSLRPRHRPARRIGLTRRIRSKPPLCVAIVSLLGRERRFSANVPSIGFACRIQQVSEQALCSREICTGLLVPMRFALNRKTGSAAGRKMTRIVGLARIGDAGCGEGARCVAGGCSSKGRGTLREDARGRDGVSCWRILWGRGGAPCERMLGALPPERGGSISSASRSRHVDHHLAVVVVSDLSCWKALWQVEVMRMRPDSAGADRATFTMGRKP